jgi:predicted nucleic acid-binding protein
VILTKPEAKGRAMAQGSIGATALVNGYTLLTRNTEHFKRIEGLKLLTVP